MNRDGGDTKYSSALLILCRWILFTMEVYQDISKGVTIMTSFFSECFPWERRPDHNNNYLGIFFD